MALWSFDVPALGTPPKPSPLSANSFVLYILPPILFYMVFATLVLLPAPRILRAALWPVIAISAFRAVVFVDFANGSPEYVYLNANFTLMMLFITIRMLGWAFWKESPKRHLRPVGSAPSIVLDVLDLCANMRGYGWTWSNGLHIPADIRPSSRAIFCLCALLSALAHAYLSGIILVAIKVFLSESLTLQMGGTLFDANLQPWAQFLRSSIISTLVTIEIYCNMQAMYDVCTMIGVTIFQQDPAQWPPAFNAPWFATSLRDFWSRRWHQFFRQTFIVVGGRPLQVLFGHVGYIFGSFLASGLWHYIAVLRLNFAVDMWCMMFSFGMMAIGILLENIFSRFTGRKVCGWLGWLWTMTWLLIWGEVSVDGFLRAGMFAPSTPFSNILLIRDFVEPNVSVFDKWLHVLGQR